MLPSASGCFYARRRPTRCLGGADSACREGHWGPLCSLCAEYYYKGADHCLACEGDGVNGTGGAIDPNGTRAFLGGLITFELQAYDAETHEVAYVLHSVVSLLAALAISAVALLQWCFTRDPLDPKVMKKKRLEQLRARLLRRKQKVGGMVRGKHEPPPDETKDASDGGAAAGELSGVRSSAAARAREERLALARRAAEETYGVKAAKKGSASKWPPSAPEPSIRLLSEASPSASSPSAADAAAAGAAAKPFEVSLWVGWLWDRLEAAVAVDSEAEEGGEAEEVDEDEEGGEKSAWLEVATLLAEERAVEMAEVAAMEEESVGQLTEEEDEKEATLPSPSPSPPGSATSPSTVATPTIPSPPPSPPDTASTGETTARILRENRSLGVGGGTESLGDFVGDFFKGATEKFKIMITHFQISSSFKFTLDMRWSWPEIDMINGWFAWVNLDAIDLARIECFLPTNFYDGLFSTVKPP